MGLKNFNFIALTVDLNSYDKSYEHYDKANAFNKNKLNLYKNIVVKPYTVIESEKINLGTYYLDSYNVDEFGSISINFFCSNSYILLNRTLMNSCVNF